MSSQQKPKIEFFSRVEKMVQLQLIFLLTKIRYNENQNFNFI